MWAGVGGACAGVAGAGVAGAGVPGSCPGPGVAYGVAIGDGGREFPGDEAMGLGGPMGLAPPPNPSSDIGPPGLRMDPGGAVRYEPGGTERCEPGGSNGGSNGGCRFEISASGSGSGITGSSNRPPPPPTRKKYTMNNFNITL